MKIEIKHYIDLTYAGNVSRTEKVWKLFGIVVKRKIYHYPKASTYDVVNEF